MEKKCWYVAYTHSRSEKKVQNYFEDILKLESYLPLVNVKRQWSDRVKWVELPLFTSYVFVKTTADNLHELANVFGVARFLSFEGRFAAVRDEEIDLIKKILKDGEEVSVEPRRFIRGQKVIVTEGAFEGLEGTLMTEHNTKRFIVKIAGIAQNISVSIPAKSLRVLNSTRATA